MHNLAKIRQTIYKDINKSRMKAHFADRPKTDADNAAIQAAIDRRAIKNSRRLIARDRNAAALNANKG
jgi:hypothetical protein